MMYPKIECYNIVGINETESLGFIGFLSHPGIMASFSPFLESSYLWMRRAVAVSGETISGMNHACLPLSWAASGSQIAQEGPWGQIWLTTLTHQIQNRLKMFKARTGDRSNYLFYALPSWWSFLSIPFTCCYYSSIRLFMVQGWTFLAFSHTGLYPSW